MSLDVFLSFRRCPKHPNTPPFDFGTPIAYFGNPLSGRSGEIATRFGEIGGDRNEIEWRFRGAKAEKLASFC
jgi:hypothetical protein